MKSFILILFAIQAFAADQPPAPTAPTLTDTQKTAVERARRLDAEAGRLEAEARAARARADDAKRAFDACGEKFIIVEDGRTGEYICAMKPAPPAK